MNARPEAPAPEAPAAGSPPPTVTVGVAGSLAGSMALLMAVSVLQLVD